MKEIFLENLIRLMTIHGHNAYDLEDITGISQPTINRILNEIHEMPKYETIRKIAKAYNITTSHLVGELPIDWDAQENKTANSESTMIRENFQEIIRTLPEEKLTDDFIRYVQYGAEATQEELKRNNNLTFIMRNPSAEYTIKERDGTNGEEQKDNGNK